MMWWWAVLAGTILASMKATRGAEVGVEQVGIMVGQVVKLHLSGCHVVLLTGAPHSPVLSAITK